jgi:ribosomal-protein-alanine N-acetyltransferase
MDLEQPVISIEIVTVVDNYLREIMLSIDEEVFGPASLNEWSLPPLLHYGRVYLAKLDGKPVGSAQLMRDWRDSELIYLYGFAVMPDYQGNGVGTALLRHIFESMPRAGFSRLQLTVHPENHLALHIYEDKFQMKRIDFLKDYYGPGEDRWLLEWNCER